MSSSDPSIDGLRASVDRLSLENARLRQQLTEATAGRLSVLGAPTSSPLEQRTTSDVGHQSATRRRRWLGNTIGVVLLVVGFALGVLVSSREGSLMNRAFREGYEDGAAAARARREAPSTAPPSPASPAPAAPTTPAPPVTP